MVIQDSKFVYLPRAVRDATLVAKDFLSKPAHFAATFLAEGASLPARTVALACANGVIACGPEFCIYTPSGVPLSWAQASVVVRAFGKSLGRYEHSLYKKCEEEVLFRSFQREAPKISRQERWVAKTKQFVFSQKAKKLAEKKKQAREELASRRNAGCTKKAALRRQLKKKKSSCRKVQKTSKPESFNGLVRFLRDMSLLSSDPPPLAPFQEKVDHPGPLELEAEALLCPPIVGFAPGPLLPRIYRETNTCLPYLAAVSSVAASDLRNFICNIHHLNHGLQVHVLQSLTLLARIFPLCPVRGIVETYFPMDLVTSKDMPGYIDSIKKTAAMIVELSDPKQEIHSIFDSFKKIAKCVSDAKNRAFEYVSERAHDMLDAILAKIRAPFMNMISPYFQLAQKIKDEIENFWNCCVSWARNLWSKTHVAIQALGTYSVWAIVIMILVGIMHIIEMFLICVGAPIKTGMLVSLLTGVLFASLGYTVYAMGREYISFLRCMREVIYMTVIPDSALADIQGIPSHEIDGEQTVHSFMDTAMAPVHFLESIASGLSFFSTNSITVLGKLGNSLEGVRKGFNCLKDFLAILMNSFGNAYEHISGKRTNFFRLLAGAIKIPMDKWVKDARNLIEHAEIVGNLDKYQYYTVRELIYQGQEIMDLSSRQRQSHTSASFLRIVGKIVEDLKVVRAKCARSLKFPGWRRQPFWVYAYGASQCGKSTLANYLMPLLLSHMGWDPSDVYSKDPVDGYWSGYYQQKGLKMNDLSAVAPKNVTCLEQQLIPLISTEEKLVSSAEIEGKGVQFMSEIVVSSSNLISAPTSAGIEDESAYKLRRKVMLECRRAAEWIHHEDGTRTELLNGEGQIVYKPYDPANALMCTEVRWKDNNTNVVVAGPKGQWHLAEYTVQMVKEAMDAHFRVEDQKMANWQEQLGMKSHTAMAMTSYLQDMIMALGVYVNVPGSGEQSPRHLLVAVDGVVYKLDSTGKAVLYEGEYTGIEELERETLLNYRVEFSNSVYRHGTLTDGDSYHASTVCDFIDDMLKDGASVVSVDQLASSTHTIHQELWKELGLSEKIFLRVSQKALNQVRDAPHFKEHITSNFLESMRIARDAIVDNKEKILLFFCAVALVGATSWGFFQLVKSFASGGLGFGAGLALKNQLASHSAVHASGSDSAAWAATNIPVVWGHFASKARAHSAADGAKEFDYMEDGLAHMVCRIVGTSGHSETALLYGHHSIALCLHQVRLFPDNDRVAVHYFSKESRLPQCFSFTWHYGNVIEQPMSEICIYNDAQLTPLPVYSDSCYLRGDQKLPTVININGISIKKRKFFDERTLSPSEKTLDPEMPIVRSWSDVATLTTAVQTITGAAYKRDINRYYVSSYPAAVHDSGGLITTLFNGRRVAVGMHCAGSRQGYLFKSTIGLLPSNNISSAHSAPDYFVPATGIETKGYCKIGWISNPSKRPHTGSKTAFVPIEPRLALPLPEDIVTKVPSILSKKDIRLQTEVNPEYRDYDPLKNGMEKFANPMDTLDDKLLGEVCEDIYQTWYDALPSFEDEKQFLTKVSLEVALQGIPGEACYDAMRSDTSEGYPYTLERKQGESGKSRYIFIDEDGTRSLVQDTSVYKDYYELSASVVHTVPVLNCVECPKDELLKPGKVFDKPGTRLFDTLPFVHNILLREYFLNFCTFLQFNRLHLPCSVGINPYSKEWTWLYDRLASKSDKALNCDYSKFDGLISHQVYMHMVATINRLFKDGEEANCARKNLFLMFTARRSIAYDQVYMVKGGMPSGCALTVVINSILNEILVRYVYKRVVPAPARNYFNKYVELIVYGDDNLIAISDDVVDFFDGPIIQKEMKQVGVTITDGTDKLSPTLERKPLESLDFLKRGFRKVEGGAIYAPLDLSSLYSRLYYTTAGENGLYQLDILHDNVKSFLEELYLHKDSYKEFNRVRDFYIARIPSWRDTLPTWSSAVDFMDRQQSGSTPWQPHRFIETRPHGGEHKMMAGQDKHDQAIWCTNRLSICGLKYTPAIKENAYIVAIDTPLRVDETGIAVKTIVDRGAGHLPTDTWIRNFGSPKKYPGLHEAYSTGATIYFRSRMPFFWGWCALIKFAGSKGIDQSSLIALYEQYKPRGAGDIAPLVASEEYRRFLNRPMFNFQAVQKRILEERA
uniref:RNA1 polyprotein n=1 Tax=Chrysanthemum nepovirus TaxID=3115762 RepID=A0AAT9JIS2_9SECO